MKKILAPSILSADLANLERDISKTVSCGAELIHFDVMDGIFVPNISFGLPVLESVHKCTSTTLDTHLMIDRPQRYIKRFVEAGSGIVTFHIEATEDPIGCLKMIKNLNAKSGISIKPATDESVLYPLIDLNLIDLILVMSVEPGFGGQKFISHALDKIRNIRDYITKNNKQIDIEVDGGINNENVEDVIGAGANVIVAGSSIFNGDIEENTKLCLKK